MYMNIKASFGNLFIHRNTYFHTFFYPYVFPQNLNNVIKKFLPDGP